MVFDMARLSAPFDSWDPLLQKHRPVSMLAPATPASNGFKISCSSGKSTAPTPTPSSGSLSMPPPPPRESLRVSKTPPPLESSPITPAAPAADAPAPVPEHLSVVEMEAQSLALAYQLQQEEHAAFISAVRVSSPTAAAGPLGGLPASAGGALSMDTDAGAVEEQEEEDMDESLRLAIRLQQEELQWHQVGYAGNPGGGGGDPDEDIRLAMELSQAEQDDDAIM